MIKEKALMTLLAVGTSLTLWSEEPQLVITTSGSDTPHSIEITGSTRISFDPVNGKMFIASDQNVAPIEFDVDQIEKITFDLETSSKEDIKTELGNIAIVNHNGLVTITTPKGEIRYCAWNSSGVTVASGTANTHVDIDFTAMQKGVYIIKANDKTIKFFNK